MAVSSANIGGQTKTPRELDLARRVSRTSKHPTEDARTVDRMTDFACAVNPLRAPVVSAASRPPVPLLREWTLCGARAQSQF
jgi:hypothetical protein